jgi:hypothetical protein
LPTNVLTGNFTLTDLITQHSTNFSVEEYKRPKFLVEISKPTGTYRLNENITVNGTAKAYAAMLLMGYGKIPRSAQNHYAHVVLWRISQNDLAALWP